MPGFDWNLLDGHVAWLQKLRELLSEGRNALQLADLTRLDAAEADLQEFIARCQVYQDLRTQARAGLAELLSRDLAAIITRLGQLPLAAAGPARQPLTAATRLATPHQYLAAVQAALHELHEQHRRQPYEHPHLTRQLVELLATIRELLAPPAEPEAKGQPAANGTKNPD